MNSKELASKVTGLRRESAADGSFSILVSLGTCGVAAGGMAVLDALKSAAKGKKVRIVEVGCMGLCYAEPTIEVIAPDGKSQLYGNVKAEHAEAIVKSEGKAPVAGPLAIVRSWYYPEDQQNTAKAPQARIVLRNCGRINPEVMEDYLVNNGYQALANVLATQTSKDVVDTVTKAGLRGRGGGGFPTGVKWGICAAQTSDQKYIICNADEGDPGAFMDRAVLEGDPHAVIEGMAIGGYAIGATKGIIYIRAEYPLAIKRLKIAIEQARKAGFLGQGVCGSGFDFDIQLKYGAGAFVCGEETALMRSIEGKRGMPTYKPPFPAVKGLWRKPTVINNVETFANVPAILRKGAPWFTAIGTQGSPGTKVFSLTGKINHVGLIEVAMGITLKDIIFGLGDGIKNGRRFKAVQTGGPSGGCITAANLGACIDYDTLKALGSMMGSGGMIVMDQDDCMVDIAKFFVGFTMEESCGECTPCRIGGRQMHKLLSKITSGNGTMDDLALLTELGNAMKATSLCGLGQTSANPVLSTMRWFANEYEAHIRDGRCPAGACKPLVGAPCQNGCPANTEVWRYVAHIGRGEYEEAYKAIRTANPFPSACARVCNHPCEERCRAGGSDGDAVAIRALKRFVVDKVDPRSFPVTVAPAGPNAVRIAIVGGGPTGLVAAHELSRRGHRVTLIEREAVLGGMLVEAIPSYRLPRDTLKKEIESLLNENITVRTGVELGKDVTVDGLLADHKAVLLGLGAHQSKRLELPGEDVEGVIPGIRFLKAHNLHGKELGKGRVGIIGGGNSAMDAARVALRQKDVTSVTMFYRRTLGEMPAYSEEIHAGQAEGIVIQELVAPVAVHAEGGKLVGLRLQKNRLGEREPSGRQKPVPIPGSEFDVSIDTLIVAISEDPEGQALGDLGKNKWGAVSINARTFMTSKEGVFACGDMVTGPNTVIDCIGAAKLASQLVDRFVRGMSLELSPLKRLPTLYLPPTSAPDPDAPPISRLHQPELPAAARQKNFLEVELPIEEAHAIRESSRCLRCDLEFTRPR